MDKKRTKEHTRSSKIDTEPFRALARPPNILTKNVENKINRQIIKFGSKLKIIPKINEAQILDILAHIAKPPNTIPSSLIEGALRKKMSKPPIIATPNHKHKENKFIELIRLKYTQLFLIFAVITIVIGVSRETLSSALISIEIFSITLIAMLVPSIVSYFSDTNKQFLNVNFETILFTIVVYGGSVLLNGSIGSIKNFLCILGIFGILMYGSCLVEDYKNKKLNTIAKYFGIKEFTKIKSVFDKETKSYYIIPFTVLTTNLLGLWLGWEKSFTLFTLTIVLLSVAAIIILFFLINSFLRMFDSLRDKKIFFPHHSKKSIKIEEREEKDLISANKITDLRKILLYDSIHNLALFFAFVTVILMLLDVSISGIYRITGFFLLSFVFTQVPYTISQYLLHNKILENYEDLKREDLKEKLKKYAPLCPKPELIYALIAPHTFGYILWILLEAVVSSLIN